MKFSFGRDERMRLFKEIEGHNSRLRELLNDSDEITQLSKIRNTMTASSVAKSFCKFWTHASRVFQLLAESWRCDCASRHYGNLMLEQRISAEVRFQLMFVYDKQKSEQHTQSWSWIDTQIHLSDISFTDSQKVPVIIVSSDCSNETPAISISAPRNDSKS
jgi:hypothetical protein